MHEKFDLKIMACNRDFYEGPAEIVNLYTTEGKIGVMAHHSNMIAAVVPGQLDYVTESSENLEVRTICVVSHGLIKVENNEVMIMVDTLETPEEIDVNRAKRAEEEAREAMLQKKSKQEYLQAQIELSRAMNRLKVAKFKK